MNGLLTFLCWVFRGQAQSPNEYSVFPDGRVWQCSRWGGLQGGDDWKRVPRYLLLFLLVFLPLWKSSRMRSEVQRRSTFQGWLEDRKGPPAAVAVTVAGAHAGGRRCRDCLVTYRWGTNPCVESVPVPSAVLEDFLDWTGEWTPGTKSEP